MDSNGDRLEINKINTAVKVKIERINVKMRIDTCSDVNIKDEYSFNKIKNVVKLEKTNIRLYGDNYSDNID